MIRIRIIANFQIRNQLLVKSKGFQTYRTVGSLHASIRLFEKRDIDELLLTDVTCVDALSKPDIDFIKTNAADCFMPLSISGGIRSLDHATELFASGADKVTVGRLLISKPEEVAMIRDRHGSQSLIASIDVRHDDNMRTYIDNGSCRTGLRLERHIKLAEEVGCGEILVTSICDDGSMMGPNVDIALLARDRTNLPLLYSGGIGEPEHLSILFENIDLDGVAIGSMFFFTEHTPLDCARFLHERGFNSRI
tara:strand:- start:271 stop:1023 length:753 start_codon:yes stop_codon:yes gene_type:complete